MLNKNARYKITVVFMTKTSPRLYRPGGGGKVVVYVLKEIVKNINHNDINYVNKRKIS